MELFQGKNIRNYQKTMAQLKKINLTVKKIKIKTRETPNLNTKVLKP